MATIKDVADRAGVTKSTVSYALSGTRSISEEVRKRVADAVLELGYKPNSLSKRFRQGRSYTIGMICPAPSQTISWLVMEIVAGSALVSNEADYTLGFYMRDLDAESITEMTRTRTVDGLILLQIQQHDPRIEALRKTDFPFVMIGRTADNAGLPYVDFNFEQGCVVALEHLVQQGHQQIGVIAPPDDTSDLGYMLHIEDGLRQAKKKLKNQFFVEHAGSTIKDGFQATSRLLEKHPEITAIFNANGGGSHPGMLHALRSAHRHVPNDCALVGFSTDQEAQWLVPTLTSVHVPLSDIGRMATEMLLRKLENPGETEQILIPATLIARESSGAYEFAQFLAND
jgi:DNA-binding LacI/PurR family transcriptional regulator